MNTILITGGGGFLGSNLAAGLTARGHRVVVCDAFGASDKWRNLVNHPVWEIIAPDDLAEWLEANGSSVGMVYHLGSISSTTERDMDLILKHNLTSSIRLWRWCNQHGVRFVYASAAATYGDGSLGFDDRADLDYLRALKPLSGYGWSKHLFDLHVASEVAQGAQVPPQWVGLKFFNVYGPNEYHKESQRSVIGQIAEQAMLGGAIRLFRSGNPAYVDGAQLRDVLYVKDAVAVMLWLLDHPNVSGLYNLGTGHARTFNDMATAIFAALGRPARVHYIDMPESLTKKYQYFTEAQMDRLREAGYTAPFTSVEEGVRDYLLNYLTKEDPYL